MALWGDRFGGADVGFDSDFFGHERLRVEMKLTVILSQSAQQQINQQILRLEVGHTAATSASMSCGCVKSSRKRLTKRCKRSR